MNSHSQGACRVLPALDSRGVISLASNTPNGMRGLLIRLSPAAVSDILSQSIKRSRAERSHCPRHFHEAKAGRVSCFLRPATPKASRVACSSGSVAWPPHFVHSLPRMPRSDACRTWLKASQFIALGSSSGTCPACQLVLYIYIYVHVSMYCIFINDLI